MANENKLMKQKIQMYITGLKSQLVGGRLLCYSQKNNAEKLNSGLLDTTPACGSERTGP